MSDNPAPTESAPESAPEPAQQVESAPTETSSAPDVSEQVQLLQQRLDRIENPTPAQQEQIDGATLADRLLGQDPDLEYEDALYEDEADPYQQAQQPDPYMEKISAIEGYLQQQATQERLGELNKLVGEFPELSEDETQQKIAGALSPMADQYGDAVLTDPRLIRQALIALKAEAASANETPAEEARNRGASLETEAGARSDSGESDENAEIARAIVNAGPPASEFG